MKLLGSVIACSVAIWCVIPRSAAAQNSASLSPWYGRGGAIAARVDGGVWSERRLRGFDLAIGREQNAGRSLHTQLEVQAEWLSRGADDATCQVLAGTGQCAPRFPALRIYSLGGGLVVERNRFRLATLVGPSLAAVSGAGVHGGPMVRLEVSARIASKVHIAASAQTTRLQSLQSTTIWIPRAGVGIRIAFP